MHSAYSIKHVERTHWRVTVVIVNLKARQDSKDFLAQILSLHTTLKPTKI